MTDLVVCCDGTWQDVTDRSNVVQLHDRLGPEVTKHYVKGVGTGGLLDHLRGGIAGSGIDDDLLEGYRFIVDHHRPGDRIAVFGFSRGAYLARSLAGMVGTVGIVDRTGLGPAALAAAVDAVYARYRTHKADQRAARDAGQDRPLPRAADDGVPLIYDPRTPDIPVALVGVWDTVGALGIPSYLGLPDLLGSRERYEFLDVVLDPRIPYARHAVSLDEMRGPFRPTLWEAPAPGSTQDIAQVWFPGDHCDVGGGHPDDSRLSDGALHWMIEQARKTIGLPIIDAPLHPDPVGGTLHGMAQGLSGAVEEAAMQPRPRAVPCVDPTAPRADVDPSAHQRQVGTADGPPERRYRPTRTLQVGESAEVVVAADRSWNATDLHLEPGTYRFTAAGRWSTPLGSGGPSGAARWPVLGDGFGGVVDSLERGLRALLHNPDAELVGARREADEPLMVLVGLVADEVTDATGRVAVDGQGRPTADEKFVIGDAVDRVVERAGYLWAFGNDAWGSYGNNRGQVTLTVRRLPADPGAPTPGGPPGR